MTAPLTGDGCMVSSLRSLFGRAVVTAEMAPRIVDEQLFPEELAYLRDARAKRRAEFGTARVCARRALAALGIAPLALVPRADRAPFWPKGVVGSISHTRDRCAVVVAVNPPLRSLGLDIETVRPLDAGVKEAILTRREIAHLHSQPGDDHERLLVLLFSAKEAYYKCQYAVTGAFLGFHDVEIEVEGAFGDAGRFEASALKPRLPQGLARIGGKFVCVHDTVMCGIELPVVRSTR